MDLKKCFVIVLFLNFIESPYFLQHGGCPLRGAGLLVAAVARRLGSEECLSVIAYYNQYGEYSHEVDQFKTIVTTDETFDTSEPDEAQRIKLVTYYTFKSIPIEENWETLINYRIYAN